MIKIFETREETVLGFAENLESLINKSILQKEQFNVALSGGSTPQLLFKLLKNDYKDKIDWTNVHFYWGDERCVDSDSPESNYGVANNLLLKFLDIPNNNIHFINGNNNPEQEAKRYSEEIEKHLTSVNDLPNFDLVILGLGNDGHTASIFPNQLELLNSQKICDVAIHPNSFQKRITLTGKVINNAKNISFIVLGEEKREVAGEIINKEKNYLKYPASYVKPITGKLEWFLDKKAGKSVNSEMFKNS